MSVKVIKFYDEVKLKPNKKSSSLVDIYETKEINGKLVYKKTNTINRQALMNSEAKNCDISVLYKRLIKGDNSVLNTREGVYLNTTDVPKDILEMNNYSKFIEKYFNESALLKSVYKNDFQAYFLDYQKGLNVIKEKIDLHNSIIFDKLKKDIATKTKKSEVKENENK